MALYLIPYVGVTRDGRAIHGRAMLDGPDAVTVETIKAWEAYVIDFNTEPGVRVSVQGFQRLAES